MPQYVITANKGLKFQHSIVFTRFLISNKKIPFGIDLQYNLV